jgi:thiamine-monophosphate kinase
LHAACWALADAHGCELIGGDTADPLNICITVFGCPW